MNTLERYIFKRVFVASMGAFLAMLSVVWVTQAVTRIDFATGSAQSTAAFLHMMVMLIPQFITLTLPFGILIGTVQVFNGFNADSELPVFASSGVHRMAILKPVMVMALMASAYVLFASHFIEPQANRAVRDIITESRTDFLTSVIQPGRFNQAERGLVIYVEEKDASNTLTGLMIADSRDPKTHLIYYAQRGIVDQSTQRELLVLENGQLHRKDMANGAVSIIRYRTYAVDLSQFANAATQPSYNFHERDTADLLSPDLNDTMVQRRPGHLRAELHKRFSEWLYPILFALVAMVMAGQPKSHRAAAISTAFLAFGGGVLYRWGGYFSYNETKTNPDMVWLLYAIPLGGILLCLWMFRYGYSIAIPDWVVHWASRLKALFSRAKAPKTVRAV